MENKIARLMRNTGPARFFIPVGLILIIFGIILSGFKTDNYAETKGKITSVVENTSNTDSKGYDVSFTYTVDGKEQTYWGDVDAFDGHAYYEGLRQGKKITTSLLNTHLFLTYFT